MEYGTNEWLEDINLQVRRLTELTNNLIELSRMEEAGNAPMIEFPVSDLVTETAASFQALSLTCKKKFTLDVQPMLCYCGNKKGIRRLVSILLDNAVKYCTEEGSIHLQLEAQKKGLVLTVTNIAEGVSDDTVRNLFDRFYRGDPSRNSSVQGYGIGLSIARAIVSEHKGTIEAGAENGRLRITVFLPVGTKRGYSRTKAKGK